MYDTYVKRILDIILSVIAIVCLFPIILVISITVLINMGVPILFKQERIGRNEKVFMMYKFRTMRNSNSNENSIEDDHKRLTKLGIFLRSTSLDELPELFNILKGDMSFVGPRPFPSYYLPYYKREEQKRHSVRAGLIPVDGLLGKVNVSWDEQFEAELKYVKKVSFLTDIKVIAITFKLLFIRAKSNYGEIERPLLNEVRKKNG